MIKMTEGPAHYIAFSRSIAAINTGDWPESISQVVSFLKASPKIPLQDHIMIFERAFYVALASMTAATLYIPANSLNYLFGSNDTSALYDIKDPYESEICHFIRELPVRRQEFDQAAEQLKTLFTLYETLC